MGFGPLGGAPTYPHLDNIIHGSLVTPKAVGVSVYSYACRIESGVAMSPSVVTQNVGHWI